MYALVLRRIVLVLLLALPCVLGPLTSYLMMLLALLAVPAMLARRSAQPVEIDVLAVIFLATPVLVFALYAVTAQVPRDMTYGLNFLFMLAYLPLKYLFGQSNRTFAARSIGTLALAGAALALILALIEVYVLHAARAGYLTSDPIRFGNIATLLGFLALIGWTDRTAPLRWLYLLGPLLAIGALLLSGSRSPLLVFPILVAIAVFCFQKRKLAALAIVAGLYLAMAVVFLALDALLDLRSFSLIAIVQRLAAGEGIADQSLSVRLEMYRASLEAFATAPIFGHGWANLTTAVAPYFSGTSPLTAYPHLHNDLLDFAIAGGIFGVALYAALIVGPVWACLGTPRDTLYAARLYGCIVLSVSYLVLGSSSLMFGFEFPTGLYVGLSAILIGYCRVGPAGR